MKKHNPELRAAIISAMKQDRERIREVFGDDAPAKLADSFAYCTFHLKSSIYLPFPVIRREVDRMERDGIIRRGRNSSTNNTQWVLLSE